MSIFVVGMDISILNVALPSLQHDLHASVAGAQWTLDAYTLVIACLLMLSASTADRIGRRRVFQTGLAIFTLGSALCSVAPSLDVLILARVVQAIGGSMLNPVAMAIITNTFLDPRERARAIGIWGAAVGIAVAAGPVIGGLLVEGISWRGVFWVNIPVCLAAIALTARHVPESKAPRPRRVDPAGQALVIGAIGPLTYAIIEAPGHGWGSPEIVGCFAFSVLCLVALAVNELHRREPLIDMRFFRSPPFAGATAIALCALAALGGYLLLNTLYLQDVRGFSPLRAGIAILPMAALMVVFGPLSGRTVGRHGPRPSLLIGGAALAAAGLISAIPRGEPAAVAMYAAYALIGCGLGWINAAITNTAVAGMPRQQAGVAAGITSTMRQLGQTLGVAVVGTVVASHVAVVAPGPAFMAAYRTSWGIIAGCGVVVFALALVTTGAWGRRAAAANAARLDVAEIA